MADPTTVNSIPFGGVNPVLRVRDVAASRDYYVRALGFRVDFETPNFISVSRGRCGLFLSEGDQGHPGSWVWIDGKDVADRRWRSTHGSADCSCLWPGGMAATSITSANIWKSTSTSSRWRPDASLQSHTMESDIVPRARAVTDGDTIFAT